MIRIELEPLEQKDILEMLDYANEMKEQNRQPKKKKASWDDTDYWINRIEYLKRIVQGKAIRESIYRSSLRTIDMENTHEEKMHQRYQKRKEEIK